MWLNRSLPQDFFFRAHILCRAGRENRVFCSFQVMSTLYNRDSAATVHYGKKNATRTTFKPMDKVSAEMKSFAFSHIPIPKNWFFGKKYTKYFFCESAMYDFFVF